MRVLILSLGVILLDQVTKLTVRFSFAYGIPHNIVGDFIRLTYIENPGMAFGIRFANQTFFVIFASLATVIVFVYIVRAQNERLLLRAALALIFGGAVGNLIDRLLYGKVVDFIDVGIGATRWPIFNLADSAVTIGMCIIVVFALFVRGPGQGETDAESTA